MRDEKARAAIIKLSHLFEQSIQLAGNHLHHSVLRPQLEEIRQYLSAADGPAPAPLPQQQQPKPAFRPTPPTVAMSPAPPQPPGISYIPAPPPPPATAPATLSPLVPVAAPNAPPNFFPFQPVAPAPATAPPPIGADDMAIEAAATLAMVHGTPVDGGCRGCGRTTVQLIAQGHGYGCQPLHVQAAP
jgi:hypothetical protein